MQDRISAFPALGHLSEKWLEESTLICKKVCILCQVVLVLYLQKTEKKKYIPYLLRKTKQNKKNFPRTKEFYCQPKIYLVFCPYAYKRK